MIELYAKPRTAARFQEYLIMLQGSSGKDIILPIAGFNPMAKEHVLQKLMELRKLDVEKIMKEVTDEINLSLVRNSDPGLFKVALNLADDLKGGWTNRFSTDYDSKFKINALVSRQFCTPYFWSSEDYDKTLIRKRTAQYIFRTIYRLSNPAPTTLEQHIAQEFFVARNAKPGRSPVDTPGLKLLDDFYKQHKGTENHNIIFNFFYGDEAAKSLGYPAFGMKDNFSGFDYAEIIASEHDH
ncbi:MAG: hypothetical protein HKN76_17040 [Saprospiraceae bacterium]|nr:hypothetical protein [Saprospiraceae bacterium]